MSVLRSISFDELAKHNTRDDCWVAINGKVYDLTTFLSEHPAGPGVIIKQAGKDGTEAFKPYHSPNIIETLGKESLCVGVLDVKSVPVAQPESAVTSQAVVVAKSQKPSIGKMLNVFDFEAVAKTQMSHEGWSYYSSGADDEVTLRENHVAFSRVWLKPRVMRNVKNVDISSTILGYKTSFPLYITATALAKLAHPDGEVALTRACHDEGIVQMLPTLASCSLEEMCAAKKPGQIQFFQLYVNSNREVTKKLVQQAEKLGCRGLFITVDAPMLGRREKDMRNKFVDDAPSVQKGDNVNRGSGTARAISQFIDPSLCWDDIPWFKSITGLPLILKGIQCGEDAVLALRAGCQGVVVSNHGGRQLDYTRSGVEMLEEVTKALRAAGAPKEFEVYVDGGIRRGSDIFKALALGAKAVGIGRPTLYGLAAYGEEGVSRVLQILKEELHMCMTLSGVTKISEINESLLLTRNLGDHVSTMPRDNLYGGVYEPLRTQVELSKL
eukprot:c8391_g1_i1.p1 GENE.c8391_g1_i1~~c8391_g1_i1.p1  ORF type:complete len:518 (+),score=124.79 c8391_g1_i1:65-1555(+)